MIPKENRLKRMKDFEILFKEGNFVGGDLVNIKFWEIEPEKYPKKGYGRNDLKIGFVVGIKVNRSAVKRNKVKRRLREIIRLILAENKLKDGYMVAIMAKPESVGKDYKEIESAVFDALEKANLIKKD